jgi:hypothetical protein
MVLPLDIKLGVMKRMNIPLSRKRTSLKYTQQKVLWCFITLLISGFCRSQSAENSLRLGAHVGYSQQDIIPFNDDDYAHTSRYIKLQLGKEVWIKDRQSLEVLIEPSVYFVEHQLLNLFFITPSTPNFQAQRDLFTQNRSYEEYALNLGLVYGYELTDRFKAYGMISIGPMTATAATERQKKGFSFSDILGMGMRYQIGRLNYDIRVTLRHVSNANLRLPNSGHNSAGIEMGFSSSL